MKKKISGTKNDTGKLPWHLIPFDALDKVVEVLQHGASKYGDRNWEEGIDYSRIFGGVMRRLSLWGQGHRLDAESGKSHLWHAATGILFLIAYEVRGVYGEFDDMPDLG